MSDFKKMLLGAVAVSGLFLGVHTIRADDAKPMTGVLIDNMCAKKDANKTEEGAMKHPISCAKKCEDSGFQLIIGDKHYKLDDKGNDMAKEYIKKDDASTKVTIEGKMEDDKITDVTSIKPAEKKESN